MSVDKKFDVTETGTVGQDAVDVVDLAAFRTRRATSAAEAVDQEVYEKFKSADSRTQVVNACADDVKAMVEVLGEEFAVEIIAEAMLVVGSSILRVLGSENLLPAERIAFVMRQLTAHALGATPTTPETTPEQPTKEEK